MRTEVIVNYDQLKFPSSLSWTTEFKPAFFFEKKILENLYDAKKEKFDKNLLYYIEILSFSVELIVSNVFKGKSIADNSLWWSYFTSSSG